MLNKVMIFAFASLTLCTTATFGQQTTMNATTEDAATKSHNWTTVPTIFRTGVLLRKKDGSPFRAVVLDVYGAVQGQGWRCAPNDCGGAPYITSPSGNGVTNSDRNFRAIGAKQFGIFLYQAERRNQFGANPGWIPEKVCNVGVNASSLARCVFSADKDIWVNVNDVAGYYGSFVLDGSTDNYAYDDNTGFFDIYVRVISY